MGILQIFTLLGADSCSGNQRNHGCQHRYYSDYMDVVNELEKMGDFMINISQDLYKCKLKVS